MNQNQPRKDEDILMINDTFKFKFKYSSCLQFRKFKCSQKKGQRRFEKYP